MPWDIIHWDNCVDYVPQSWAANESRTRYYWPPKSKHQIQKLILLEVEPDKNWDTHVAEYKKTVTTVEEALNALQESAYASNLDSSTEETTRKSKRRKPNFLIDSSEDEFELQSNKVSVKQKRSKHITDVNETVNDNELNTKQYLANAETSTNLRKGERSKSTTVTKIDTTTDDPFKRKLFTILEELKYGQKNILRVLESLTAANSATHLATRQFNLPITCDAELEQIENKLQNTENFEIMVKELILIGGDTVKMCTQLIMKKIMSKEMSLIYSLQGRKGKRQFNKLKVFHAILAVQSKFSNPEECVISKYIGTALATAGDRDGGRKERQKDPANIMN
ncbi:hypothetical protein RN001_005559 [Aquatica leii]|uniref:DUF4806 domain-containing protein n=1 Tax=Aquatica leii TaxID=1421715 RepID=A0AAN7SS32_9COLE|nr:hypothetical protein RN001_005559 [Aquatica leii]